MERMIATGAIIFGATGLALLGLIWLIQQRKPLSSARKTEKKKPSGSKPPQPVKPQSEKKQPAAAIPEKKKEEPVKILFDKKKPAPAHPSITDGNRWYIGAFPARALIEELSLLHKLREILNSTDEIQNAIKAVKPDFNQESRIGRFIYENNLQYFEIVSRDPAHTVYIREGQNCSADNDRCIFYKGYLWLDPEGVDYKLSSPKPG